MEPTATIPYRNTLQQPDEPRNSQEATATMPPGKDYFDHGSCETAPDSDRDHQIRDAPYLPRVQVWARDDGPYTLRIGHQWFHCDELVVNGAEYRQRAKRDVTQARQTTPSNQAVYPPAKSRRPAANRTQSYQRTRPDKDSTAAAPVIHQDTDRPAPQYRYQPQSLPSPRELAERRRAERRRQEDADAHKQTHPQQRQPRRDSGVSVGTDVEAPLKGALVQYEPRPPTERQASEQARPARPTRPRPGRKGSSFDRAVRSKTKKAVRFAALT